MRCDIILLEFGPRVEVVEWAKQWVSSHPETRYILMNHEYLEKGEGRRTMGLKCKSQFQNTNYVTPDELWNELIKCNDNIRVVLCGHVGELYALTVDINDFGREIPQIQHNIQSPEYRYDNWLMLWEFPAESDSANVFIYNTQTGQYYDDKKSLFKFRYKDSSPATSTTIVNYNLPSQKVYGIDGVLYGRRKRGVQIIKDKKIIKK